MRGLLLCGLLLAGLSACSAAPLGQRTVDEVRATGSLRGSELDGAWALPARGHLQTEPALRRRFDHLLTAVGECGLPEIRRFIEREVGREQGTAAATQVLAAWDEHLAVLQGRPGSNAQAAENAYPAQEAAPATRSLRRPMPLPRALLAPDEPASAEGLRALHAQRVERFGSAAAERLRREDEQRWDWSRRLADARTELKALPSPAHDAALARRFRGAELLRARTLLGLPP